MELPRDQHFIFVAGVGGLFAAYAQIEVVDETRCLQELVANPRFPQVVEPLLNKAGLAITAVEYPPRLEPTIA